MGNRRSGLRILDRLVGLETEYAIRFQPSDSDAPSATKFRLYQAIVQQLQRQVLTVVAGHFKDGVFSANGGAVWFESEQPCGGAGLIEGSTPECRGARQLLAYQRAQDRLLGEAAQSAAIAGNVSLLKNDRDAFDNVYGSQENYEATLASGWRLWLWRIGLIAILPVAILTWLGLLGIVGSTLLYFFFAGLLYLLAPRRWRQSPRLAKLLLGDDWLEGRTTGRPSPRWLEVSLLVAARITTFPFAAALYVLLHLFAFHGTRQRLLPFLLTRAIFSGSGMVDKNNRFQLADKAPAINCVLGFGGVLFDRPIFNFGHFFKAYCVEVPFAPLDFFELFRERQRLQIGLGDSNMAEVAEFLKVGTTLLVLDVIEAGEMPSVPKVARPIQALRSICDDPTLQTPVVHSHGFSTAIDLQRFYWNACHAFVSNRPDSPDEAHEILRCWKDCLDRLESSPESLVGAVDWVTKKYVLDQVGEELGQNARKKIDLRYHELSSVGYFQQLADGGLTKTILSEDELSRAMRMPPPDTPATMRGHYIREFASGSEPVTANWRRVTIGHGRHAKIVRLSRYVRRVSVEPDSPDESPARNNP